MLQNFAATTNFSHIAQNIISFPAKQTSNHTEREKMGKGTYHSTNSQQATDQLLHENMGFRVSAAVAAVILLNVVVLGSGKVGCPPKSEGKCPKDAVKLGVCGSWLGLISEQIGAKPSQECCSLVKGLADLEAALCLCTVLKANVLGIVKVEVPVALSLLLNSCGKTIPQGFVCA